VAETCTARWTLDSLVEFDLEDGATVLIQASGPPAMTTRGGGRSQEKAQESLERAASTVRPAAETMLAAFIDMENAPTEISLEFGVQFSAEAGAFIGTVSGGANFAVTVKWARPDTPQGPNVG